MANGYTPKNQFEQFCVDSFSATNTAITTLSEKIETRCATHTGRLDAMESDIFDIDREVEGIHTEREVEKGKRKMVLWILGGVWTGIVIFVNWLLGRA